MSLLDEFSDERAAERPAAELDVKPAARSLREKPIRWSRRRFAAETGEVTAGGCKPCIKRLAAETP
jgi:hypothetical protein